MTTNPRRPMDLAPLGIPAGRYMLPDAGEYQFAVPDRTRESADRIAGFCAGQLTAADLQAAEIAFLREFFGQQITDRRAKALADYENRVPRRYNAATPDDRGIAWAASAVNDPENTRSLLILGPTGTGKTHYAYATLRALAAAGTTQWKAMTAADLYASLRPRAGRDSEAEFEALAEAAVLFVDDLGAAKLTEWTEEVTYRLINSRYEQCVPGLFTSNVPPTQLRDVLGERIASRLTEMCERISLKGEDRRKGMAA